MRKILLAIALTLGMASTVYADGMNTVVGPTTRNPQWQVEVFNDSGGTIASGWVVVWDNDDTEFDRSGYPYVTTTTSADDSWVAGVVAPGLTCANQTMCTIIVYGPAITLMAESTDASTEDLLVGTSSVAGMAGDYTVAADSCALGTLMEDRDVDSGSASVLDGQRSWVFVDVACQ